MGKAAQLRRHRRQARGFGHSPATSPSPGHSPSKSASPQVIHVPTEEEHLDKLLKQACQLAQESFPGKGRGMVSVKLWQEQGMNMTGMTYKPLYPEMNSKLLAELNAYDPHTQFVVALVHDDGSLSVMTFEFDQLGN